jgi:hypothetical protein
LYAGQHYLVGSVKVWNDADYLYVQYLVNDKKWRITETHLHVADSLEGIPQKNGNPPPGKFDYKGEHDCVTKVTYKIPLDCWDCNDILYIAAHAVVGHDETAWGCGPDGDGCLEFPGKNWATYLIYTLQCEQEEEWPEGGVITVAFEDLPEGAGNAWDYNDWVADIQTKATFFGTTTDRDLIKMDFLFMPEARGAGFNHAFHMLIPADTFGCDGTSTLTLYGENGVQLGQSIAAFDASMDNDFTTIPDTTEALPGKLTNSIEPPGIVSHYPTMGNTNVNAPQHEPYVNPKRAATLSIDFGAGCPFDFPALAPGTQFHGEGLFFGPYLYVKNTGQEIHVADPRMLTVPTNWMWPEAGIGVWLAYPHVDEVIPPTFYPSWWLTYNDLVYNGEPPPSP